MIALVDKVVDGVGTTASLHGVAGIGKTALLDALEQEAAKRSIPVRRVNADQVSAAEPLGALGSLLDIDLGGAQPDQAADWSPMALVPSAAAPSGAVLDKLVTAFEGDGHRPGLVIIDDAQWLDRWSFVALRRLLRVAPQFSQLMVLAWRDDQTPTAKHRDLAALMFAHEIELGPLDTGSAIGVARGFVDGAVIGPILSRIVKRANGNPLHISEVMRHARATLVESTNGVDTPTDAIPTSLSRSITYRLSRLSPELSDIVSLGSALGDRFSIVDLERAVSADPHDVLDRVRRLERMGIFSLDGSEVAFTNSLYRQSEYERMSAITRRAAHARIAEAPIPGDPIPDKSAERGGFALLRHRALAVNGTDEDLAVELADAALAVRRSRPDQAVELLQLSLTVGDEVGMDERIEHLAAILIESGQSGDALDILLPEDGSRLPSSTAEVLASTALFTQARYAESAERSRRLLDVEPPAPVKAVASTSRAVSVLAAGSPAAEPVATLAISHAVATGDLVSESLARSCRGRALAYRHDYLGALKESQTAIELADRAGAEQAHRFAPYFFHSMALIDLDRHEAVAESCQAGRVRASDAASQYSIPLFDCVLAALAYRRDDAEVAHSLAMAAACRAEDLQAVQGVVWGLSIAALSELDRGATDAAAKLLDRAEHHFAVGGALLGIDSYYLAHARLLEQRGLIEEARVAVDASWAMFAELGIENSLPLLGPTRLRLARGTKTRGAVNEVVEIAARSWIGSSAPAVDAVGRWCHGVGTGDLEALRSARDNLRDLGRHRDALEASLDEAYLLAHRGDGPGARAVLAGLSGSVLGHGGQLVVLERQMHSLGVDVADHLPIVGGPDSLTVSEQDVVDQVATGRTNAQIAEVEGTSIGIVESRLCQVFRKLDVKNRAQLVRHSLTGR